MVKSMSVEKSTEEQQRQRSVSSYRGVRKRKWGKYVSEIRLPNSRQRIWLGSYDSAEKAARAFDAAMFCLRGSGARFNFASDPPNIAGGRSMTPSEIQITAARFANSESGKKSAGSDSVSGQAVESLTSNEETTSFVITSDSNNTNALSPPLSEVTVQNDTELATGSIADIFQDLGSGNFMPDFSEFPSFDDFSRDFFVHDLPGFDYGEENLDGLIIQENQDSFLWNF